MSMAQEKRIEALEKEVDELKHEAALREQTVATLSQSNKRLEAQVKDQAEGISKLKGELADQRERNARLEGYVDRVLEDDGIREGKTIEQVGAVRSETVPARLGAGSRYVGRQEVEYGQDLHSMMETRFHGERTVRKAWYDL